IVEATTCVPNPCTGTPPPDPDVACCVPDGSGFACEDRTALECAALGGVAKGQGSCAPHSCAPPVVPTATPTPAATPVESASPAPPPVPPPTPEPTATPSSCADRCWTAFFGCLDGCTSTYCAPFCQVDLGRCLDFCPG